MPGTPTPTASLAAGDTALSDGPASNAPIERERTNNRRYLRGAAWGQLVWTGRLEVSGTASLPIVRVGSIEAVALCDGNGTSTGTWRSYATGAEVPLGATHVVGGGPLAVDTFYYAYAFNDGTSVLAYQISVQPPTDSGAPSVLLQWKRGESANYRYLGWFRTDSAGNPFPMVTHRGRSLYRRGAIASVTGALGADGMRAASGAAAVGAVTAISLASRLPPHVRVALLHADLYARSTGLTGVNTLSLYSRADTTSPSLTLSAPASAASGDQTQTSSFVELEISTAQAFGHAAALNTDVIGWFVDVLGGQE